MLERGSLGDAMLNENFDYVITHEHITTDMFEDDTIRIYCNHNVFSIIYIYTFFAVVILLENSI
jgi:hypothetical protein